MGNFTALFDACVLYPAPLRDLLMHLAMTDLFRAKWTDMIHEEWIEGVLRQRSDLSREQLERTRALMNAHVRDCLVTGYEAMIAKVTLPDPDDRHVLAAAVRCGADVIVTYNLTDFPKDCMEQHGVEAVHPDDFVNYHLELAPDIVCAAVRVHRESLKRPPKTAAEYLETLDRQGLKQTVAALRQYREQI